MSITNITNLWDLTGILDIPNLRNIPNSTGLRYITGVVDIHDNQYIPNKSYVYTLIIDRTGENKRMSALVTAVAITKGGVGKSTSAVSIAHALTLFEEQRVLLVDTDPQNNLSTILGQKAGKGLGEILQGSSALSDCVVEAREGLHLLSAGSSLPRATLALANDESPASALYSLLQSELDAYDHIIIDTSPAWSLMTVNALYACDRLLIPIKLESLAIHSLRDFLTRLKNISDSINPEIHGILPCGFDRRVAQSEVLLHALQDRLSARVLTPIRYHIRVSESSTYGETIFETDSSSRAAEDFKKVASTFVNASVLRQ